MHKESNREETDLLSVSLLEYDTNWHLMLCDCCPVVKIERQTVDACIGSVQCDSLKAVSVL